MNSGGAVYSGNEGYVDGVAEELRAIQDDARAEADRLIAEGHAETWARYILSATAASAPVSPAWTAAATSCSLAACHAKHDWMCAS